MFIKFDIVEQVSVKYAASEKFQTFEIKRWDNTFLKKISATVNLYNKRKKFNYYKEINFEEVITKFLCLDTTKLSSIFRHSCLFF